jgi:hypothetical protein
MIDRADGWPSRGRSRAARVALAGRGRARDGVERDDELAPVELDGAGGELDEVDEPRDLLELPMCAMAKCRDCTEPVEVSVACHFEPDRSSPTERRRQ